MPIKRLLEAVGAIIALVSFAVIVKALVELRRMDRAEKRKREHQPRAISGEPTDKPMKRAG